MPMSLPSYALRAGTRLTALSLPRPWAAGPSRSRRHGRLRSPKGIGGQLGEFSLMDGNAFFPSFHFQAVGLTCSAPVFLSGKKALPVAADFISNEMKGIFKDGLFELAFPYDNDGPAFGLQLAPDFLVTFLVPRDFRHPEVGVGLGNCVELAGCVTVPEAAVDEDGCVVLGKDDVRGAGKALVINSIAKALFPKCMTQFQLRFCGSRVDGGHVVVALGNGNSVWHNCLYIYAKIHHLSNQVYKKIIKFVRYGIITTIFTQPSSSTSITWHNLIFSLRLMDKYTGIDLFAGAGGLSIGASLAGITVEHAIELNESAAKTYKRNHPKTNIICQDIKKVQPKDLVDAGQHVFIIMGGPPCQGFSMSNTMTRNMENPNNAMFKEFVRFVHELNPDWFLFENVWGLTNINNGQTERMIESCFESLGYIVKSKVLWASDYGVPQSRNRFFMVGNRLGIDFDFPEPLGYTVTVGDAISDLPVLSNGDNYESLQYTIPLKKASKYAQQMRRGCKRCKQNYVSRNNDLVIERYKHIGQGQNWSAIPESLMENYADKGRCHSNIYRRLREDKPSVVISNYRKSMLIHPTQDRGLSVREAARIQSFPDSYYFEGPISHIQQQIGNAVPPLLAKAVIEQIINVSKESGNE